MESDSVLPDDEVSSGNGHWFFFREVAFVKKYIYGDEIQSFNPVSEALLERYERQEKQERLEIKAQALQDAPAPIETEKDITLFNFQGRKP